MENYRIENAELKGKVEEQDYEIKRLSNKLHKTEFKVQFIASKICSQKRKQSQAQERNKIENKLRSIENSLYDFQK